MYWNIIFILFFIHILNFNKLMKFLFYHIFFKSAFYEADLGNYIQFKHKMSFSINTTI